MSAWWRAVGIEHSRVEIKLSDERFLGGVSAAVQRSAQRVGFDATAQEELIATVEDVCRDTFPLLTAEDSFLEVSIEDFADRMEISVAHRGESKPTAGLDSFAGAEGAIGTDGLWLLARVDRVQYQTEGGVSRMTLIKYALAPPGKV